MWTLSVHCKHHSYRVPQSQLGAFVPTLECQSSNTETQFVQLWPGMFRQTDTHPRCSSSALYTSLNVIASPEIRTGRPRLKPCLPSLPYPNSHRAQENTLFRITPSVCVPLPTPANPESSYGNLTTAAPLPDRAALTHHLL